MQLRLGDVGAGFVVASVASSTYDQGVCLFRSSGATVLYLHEPDVGYWGINVFVFKGKWYTRCYFALATATLIYLFQGEAVH